MHILLPKHRRNALSPPEILAACWSRQIRTGNQRDRNGSTNSLVSATAFTLTASTLWRTRQAVIASTTSSLLHGCHHARLLLPLPPRVSNRSALPLPLPSLAFRFCSLYLLDLVQADVPTRAQPQSDTPIVYCARGSESCATWSFVTCPNVHADVVCVCRRCGVSSGRQEATRLALISVSVPNSSWSRANGCIKAAMWTSIRRCRLFAMHVFAMHVFEGVCVCGALPMSLHCPCHCSRVLCRKASRHLGRSADEHCRVRRTRVEFFGAITGQIVKMTAVEGRRPDLATLNCSKYLPL